MGSGPSDEGQLPARGGPASEPTLRELLPRHLPQLTGYVRAAMSRSLRDRESASDLVGSICKDLLAERVRFEYRGEAQFLSWLRTVVLNKIRGRLRSLVAVGPLVDETPEPSASASPSELAIQKEDLGLLDRALEQLPEHYRELIVRAHLRGQSRAEVAAATGRSEGATANMLVRARAKLAGALDRLSGGAAG